MRALAAFIALGVAAHAAIPYLPLIGPPSLRFQANRSAAANGAKLDLAKEAPVVEPVKQTAPAMPAAPDEGDLTDLPGFDLASLLNPQPATENVADKPVGKPGTGSVLELPTPDLLGISPRMLAEYFHAFHQPTNSAVANPMPPLSFRPPWPPDKSSKAEYNVK